MNDTTTATGTSRGLGLGEFGLLLLLVGLIGGGLLGTKYETATDAFGSGEFNWTLFLLAAGPALVAASVCWAGNAIVTELRR
jgi:hypothetical protein